ncbi:MAG: phosphate/phosphite/phosphonate ABC transporter substrate-binding protein [Deltaproteobacteria bacterium HGW-Deltaproteobacteria-21]|nr:MAG: phosphate/phosphite/phosphonate ABC transporter substrate-binding protein [Deltaproteobacteria bacterium HGW-Deltaproteobacteria-21]
MVVRCFHRSGVFTLSRILVVFTGLLSLLFAGCGRDNVAVVDFERVVKIEKPSSNQTASPVLRVAVAAMISPKETFVSYRDLLTYIGHKIGRETEFIQRKTYREVNDLLGMGRIDIAFICSGPYAAGRKQYGLELLAVPQIQGAHDYRSYLIVKNDGFRTIEDLKGRVFAFTDPESNTGRLVPSFWLERIGERPESFFGRLIYTYSHDNSIRAVARGLVDGASVDSLIWDYYNRRNPGLTGSTRVIRQSEPYPVPPVVASRVLGKNDRDRISQALVSMHTDQEGRRILDHLGFDRFILPPEDWFENLVRIEKMLATLAEKEHAVQKP